MKKWHEAVSFKDVEDYILKIPKFTKKNQWEITKGFYDFLERPGEELSVIHVAGTNGKGSVCAYSQGMIKELGYRCGMFTSPHLSSIRERMRIDEDDISEEDFVNVFHEIMERAQNYMPDYHPTFFELLFFMAMKWFDKKKPDYIILETGLGGRLDTTNVVEHKTLCIITKIALDHMEYLGNDLGTIAAEKAGIISHKTPVVFYDYHRDVTAVLEERVRQESVEGISFSGNKIQKMKKHEKFIDFSYPFQYYGNSEVTLPTCALYQVNNAGIAITAMEKLFGRKLTPNVVQAALQSVRWSCRMEEVLPGVLIDGAHNPDGVVALIESLRGIQQKKVLLFSVVNDKNYEEMIRLLVLSDCFEEVIVTSAGGSRASDVTQVSKMFSEGKDWTVSVLCDVKEAFQYGMQIRGERMLVVAGSLYLAGTVRSLCEEEM